MTKIAMIFSAIFLLAFPSNVSASTLTYKTEAALEFDLFLQWRATGGVVSPPIPERGDASDASLIFELGFNLQPSTQYDFSTRYSIGEAFLQFSTDADLNIQMEDFFFFANSAPDFFSLSSDGTTDTYSWNYEYQLIGDTFCCRGAFGSGTLAAGTWEVTPIPAPSAAILLLTGLAAGMSFRKNKKRKQPN
jgi:hypothetical protein